MCTRSRLVYFVAFIVSFAGSAHGSRAVNIGANSVNKMTQALAKERRKRKEVEAPSLLLFISLGIPRYDACRDRSHEISL